MGRKQAREGAMKLLFQMDSNNDFSDSELELFTENFTFDKNEEKYIVESINKVAENLEEIDEHIKANLESWSIHRLAKVDLAALRISIYEILYRKDIPVEVSINEAIEIVKKYSNSDSFKFINGVLGGFVKSLDGNRKLKKEYTYLDKLEEVEVEELIDEDIETNEMEQNIEENEIEISNDIEEEVEEDTDTDTDLKEEDIFEKIEAEMDKDQDIDVDENVTETN